jgi:hypothetical protein
VLALLLAALVPTPAHAWTEASVASAQAFVEVDENAQARVALELVVRIDAGWLEGIEIAGLDPGLTLDPSKGPWATTGDGIKYRPTASVRRDGTIEIGFSGRGRSPRRGTLRIGLVYRADLSAHAITALDDGMLRIDWTFPGWRTGLDAVVLGMRVPSLDARIARDPSEGRVVRGQTTTVAYFERGHLPRTAGWTIGAELPAEDMAANLRAARVEDAVKAELGEIELHSFEENAWLSGLLALWTLAVMLGFRRACLERGARPVAWIPLPLSLRVLAVLGLGTLAPFVAEIEPLYAFAAVLGAVLFGLERTPRIATRAFAGESRRASSADLRRAHVETRLERLGWRLALDPTTPIGVICAALVLAAALLLSGYETLDAPRVIAIALFLVPPLAATRFHLPPSGAASLLALARLASAMRDEVAVDLRVIGGGPVRAAFVRVIGATSERTMSIAVRRVLGGVESVIVETSSTPIAAEAPPAEELDRAA